jgi:hypothetical protein
VKLHLVRGLLLVKSGINNKVKRKHNMKIGLIRHYKVIKDYPKGKWLYTAEEVSQWFAEYDLAEIEYSVNPIGTSGWKGCYASTMPRAIKTAKHLYNDEIMELDELREIPAPVFNGKIKLPFIGWALLIRFAYFFNKQTRVDIKHAQDKIRSVLDDILASGQEEVLIVSHAALMVYIRKELLRKGFFGPKFHVPKNGKLYVFEN